MSRRIASICARVHGSGGFNRQASEVGGHADRRPPQCELAHVLLRRRDDRRLLARNLLPLLLSGQRHLKLRREWGGQEEQGLRRGDYAPRIQPNRPSPCSPAHLWNLARQPWPRTAAAACVAPAAADDGRNARRAGRGGVAVLRLLRRRRRGRCLLQQLRKRVRSGGARGWERPVAAVAWRRAVLLGGCAARHCGRVARASGGRPHEPALGRPAIATASCTAPVCRRRAARRAQQRPSRRRACSSGRVRRPARRRLKTTEVLLIRSVLVPPVTRVAAPAPAAAARLAAAAAAAAGLGARAARAARRLGQRVGVERRVAQPARLDRQLELADRPGGGLRGQPRAPGAVSAACSCTGPPLSPLRRRQLQPAVCNLAALCPALPLPALPPLT
jgi:hypothetical protein